MSRIEKRFAQLKADRRAGLVAYVTAGDPNAALGYDILKGLPAAGADLIELGMPFTDPMADGPSVQLAGQRALKAGITVDATFDAFRFVQITHFKLMGADYGTHAIVPVVHQSVNMNGVAAYTGVGDIIVVSIKEAQPRDRVKKGDVHRAVIVRTRKDIRRADGSVIRFDSNAAVLVNKNEEPIGTRIFGPVVRELRARKHMKIISLAPEVL